MKVTRLDATKLSALLACPQRYAYAHVQHLRPKAKRDALDFGIAAHEIIDVWNRKPEWIPHEVALEDFIGFIAFVATKQKLADCHDKRRQPASLAKLGLAYADTYRNKLSYPFKTVKSPDGKELAEFNFEVPAPQAKVNLVGYLDRVVEDEAGNIFGLDFKTTLAGLNAHWLNGYKHSLQMNLYQYAMDQLFMQGILPKKPAGMIVHGMQILVSGIRFVHEPCKAASKTVIKERVEDAVQTWLTLSNAERPLRNVESCHAMYACPFLPLCETSGTQRAMRKTSDFQTEVWDPTKEREPLGFWTPSGELVYNQ